MCIMNSEALAGGVFGTVLSAVGAGIAVTDIQAIVSIIATVIGLIITIISSVVIPVIKKYIKAKEDGKVTAEEVLDIVETAEAGLKEVTKNTSSHNGEDVK